MTSSRHFATCLADVERDIPRRLALSVGQRDANRIGQFIEIEVERQVESRDWSARCRFHEANLAASLARTESHIRHLQYLREWDEAFVPAWVALSNEGALAFLANRDVMPECPIGEMAKHHLGMAEGEMDERNGL